MMAPLFPFPRRPVRDAEQYFSYGPLQFHIGAASRLAANRAKYKPSRRRPRRDWLVENISINPSQVDRCELDRPVLMASIVLDGAPLQFVIDGNHRVMRALRDGVEIEVIVLDYDDTLKVVSGPPSLLAQMRREALLLKSE
jgi:hypothetical protein